MAHSKRPDAITAERVASHAEVSRLRQLLRESRTRAAEGVFVAEGPRVVAAALDHDVAIERLYVGVHASDPLHELAARATAAGVDVRTLKVNVGDTRMPQPIFAIIPSVAVSPETLTRASLSLLAVGVNDPGNAGTMLRSAAAAGADAVGFTIGAVDAHNPKVVRASAGASFAVAVVEDLEVAGTLTALERAGVQRLGAVAHGGAAPESFDLTVPTCVVVGHETRGLDDALDLDGHVTIPMAGAESLNVAMAATVLLFEAARQRRLQQ